MAQPRVLILRAPGTNCDVETAHTFELAGGRSDVLHVNRLLENPALLRDYQILCIPGGFSYGDDVAAGRILANQIDHHLGDPLRRFQEEDRLVLGICNGFQVLIKSGLLLDPDEHNGSAATLTWNDTGRYQDRWIKVEVDGEKSVFLRGIESMFVPIAHAEGKFVPRDDATLARLQESGQLVLKYTFLDGRERPSVPFPDNPNGSIANVAGVCDKSGRVLGLMPHPERHIHPTQHPCWTRQEKLPEAGDGLRMFQNGVEYFS